MHRPFINSGENELLIGRILIHLMEVATMNSHEIGQLEVRENLVPQKYQAIKLFFLNFSLSKNKLLKMDILK